MPRPPRLYFEGAYYHVYSRGNGKQQLFFDDSDYRYFLSLFLDLKQTQELKCFAYCLMPNHFHFLVQVGRYALSVMMQSALSRFAQYFHIRRETSGHVFQGRYHDELCLRESYFLELVRYIHNNPVKPELVSRPEDWPWSSHRALALGVYDPLVDAEATLSHFGPNLLDGRREYLSFMGQPTDWTPGSIEEEPLPKPQADRPSGSRPKTLDDLAASIIVPAGVSLGELKGRSQQRSITAARHRFILEAWNLGVARAELARFIGCSDAAIAQVIKRKGRSVSTVNLLGSDPNV